MIYIVPVSKIELEALEADMTNRGGWKGTFLGDV